MKPTYIRKNSNGEVCNIEYDGLSQEQILRLEGLLQDGGFIISETGHVYPREIFEDYNKFRNIPENYHRTNAGVPAPPGFLRGNNGMLGLFAIQFLEVEKLKVHTDKLREICEKV